MSIHKQPLTKEQLPGPRRWRHQAHPECSNIQHSIIFQTT